MHEKSARSSIGKNEQGKEKETQQGGENREVGKNVSCSSKKMAKTSRPEYRVYADMKQRCLNPRHKNFHNYGGRGISICARWLESFDNFFEDMGERPPKHSIDRFPNNDGNYEPKNCRWATQQQQLENTRVVLNLDGFSQSEMARKIGSSQGCIYHRRKHGLPISAKNHALRKGSFHHNASLTEDQVTAFRKEYAESSREYGAVARMARRAGVSRDAVYLAVRNVTWKHII